MATRTSSWSVLALKVSAPLLAAVLAIYFWNPWLMELLRQISDHLEQNIGSALLFISALGFGGLALLGYCLHQLHQLKTLNRSQQEIANSPIGSTAYPFVDEDPIEEEPPGLMDRQEIAFLPDEDEEEEDLVRP